MKRIITAQEVRDKAPISKQFGDADICTHIDLVECVEITECVSAGFYDMLCASLIDYSKVKPYDHSVIYNTGQTVKRDGAYYIATCDDIDVAPKCPCWEVAPKFEDECLNEIWNSGLSLLVSLVVTHSMLPFVATQIAPQGAIKPLSNASIPFEPGTYKDVEGLLKALKANSVNAAKLVAKSICNSECISDDIKCCIDCGCADCCGRREVRNKKVRHQGYTVGIDRSDRYKRDIETLRKNVRNTNKY